MTTNSYVQRIKLVDFQSLPEVDVELSPGLTCIVGPSNLGKSATLRALRALVRNAPAPGLVRSGASKFVAQALFSDGVIETLEKGPKVSTFTIEFPDKDTIINAKSGVKAPDDVVSIWSIPNPDGREISFASQHDAPFLLNEPASAVAKVIGDLTNASLLMEAVARANKLRAEALSDTKARTREAEEAESELSGFVDLEPWLDKLKEIEAALEKAQKYKQKLDLLETILSSYDKISSKVADLDKQLEAETAPTHSLSKAIKAANLLVSLESIIDSYSNISTKITQINSSVEGMKEKLKHHLLEKQAILQEYGECPACGQKIEP